MSKRRLILLRHAKSSRDDPALPDHDRPLSNRGRKAAAAMRSAMREGKAVPDLVLVSMARRTIETLDALRPWKLAPTVDATDALYLASAPQILELLRTVNDTVQCVLVIGHNPGLQDLAKLLIGTDAKVTQGKLARRLTEKFPTGALAEFILAGSWSDVGDGSGKLVRFLGPRE